MRLLVLTVALGLCCGGAAAQGLPDLDPVAMCKKQAALVGQGDWLVKACLDQEQAAYDALKAQWDTLPMKTRSICVQQSRLIGQGYWLMQACVEQEVAANKEVEQFQFKR